MHSGWRVCGTVVLVAVIGLMVYAALAQPGRVDHHASSSEASSSDTDGRRDNPPPPPGAQARVPVPDAPTTARTPQPPPTLALPPRPGKRKRPRGAMHVPFAAPEPAPPGECYIKHPDQVPPHAIWPQICALVKPRQPTPGERNFTIVMTSYKGHDTLRNTFHTWRDTGLLEHPALHELIVHINKCTCNDTDVLDSILDAVAPKLRRRYLCNPGNRIHGLAMLNGLGAVTTPYVLFTENDRVTLRDAGESRADAKFRVSALISRALATASEEHTPFVFLERLGATETEMSLFKKFLKEHPSRSRVYQKVADVPRGVLPPREVDFGLDRCWTSCVEVARRNPHDRNRLCKPELKKGEVYDCLPVACREWEEYIGDFPLSPSGCLTAFHSVAPGEMNQRRQTDVGYRVRGNGTAASPLMMCLRTHYWSNGPQLFRVAWYHDKVVRMLCHRVHAQKAGLVFKSAQSHFGLYGRRMERFLTKRVFRKTGFIKCLFGNGLMDHVEKEIYDLHKVS
eukprot:TRINITY_DN22790_c0_g1_i2.p1 TRINITY_DN22790_c0_g1~~TRINITY_DN22790_c0_g1_i2.p1  ORF type:complete len:510 (+),score=85.30 TRINITY_DN22790_c0_g1_i2:169-1698(+)